MQKRLKTNIPNNDNKARHGAAIIAASLAALWLVFELVVFFMSVPKAPTADFGQYCPQYDPENGITVKREMSIKLDDSCVAIDTLSFEAVVADGENLGELPKITVRGYDPAVSYLITYKAQKFCVGSGDGERTVLTLDIPQGAAGVTLSFNYEGYDYILSNFKLNAREDVSFNYARCAIVFAAILLFWLCAHLGLWKVFFDGEKHGLHALAICLVCVIMALILVMALNPNREPIEYPLEKDVSLYNQYIQQFDALQKGQLHIDWEPSKELLELENPYDYGQRDGIPYLFDRALYNGKYYSYFGMAPIFTVYYPYYAVTGHIPADDTASAVFALMTAIFFSMAAVKLAAMYTKRVPLPLVLLGTVSALLSTQIFMIARGYSRVYYIATVSGMGFLAMFAWLFLCGISGSFKLRKRTDEPPLWYRPMIFAMAGVAYGLCFLSRFNIALMAAFVILPLLIFHILLTRNGEGKLVLRELKRVIPELACLAIPVIIAMGYQFWLNVTRFDSIFEFGTTYQLTVSDISKNKLRITDLPAAIFHYFLQPLLPTIDPPIMSLYYVSLYNYGHYVYVDTGMGLLAIPIMWGLLGSVGIFVNKRYKIVSKATVASILVGLVTVALFDFCLGGVIFRYTCDLTLVGALASLAIIYALYEDKTADCADSTRVLANTATAALLVLSAFVSVCLALSDNGNLTAYSPEACSFFRSLFGL